MDGCGLLKATEPEVDSNLKVEVVECTTKPKYFQRFAELPPGLHTIHSQSCADTVPAACACVRCRCLASWLSARQPKKQRAKQHAAAGAAAKAAVAAAAKAAAAAAPAAAGAVAAAAVRAAAVTVSLKTAEIDAGGGGAAAVETAGEGDCCSWCFAPAPFSGLLLGAQSCW